MATLESDNDYIYLGLMAISLAAIAVNYYNFLKKAKLIHGDRYDYTWALYLNARTHICIVCRIHGEFHQTPDAHAGSKKTGCPKCYHDSHRKTLAKFIEQSIAVHGNKYNYKLVVYIDTRTKVEIICQTHGVFEQGPAEHIKGVGCPDCAADRRSKTNNQFFVEARMEHGEYYSYGKTVYKRRNQPVIITCPVHDDFIQTPEEHLKKGCEKCNNYGGIKTSKPSLEWLGLMAVRFGINIQHSRNGGEFRIPDTRYHVDGYSSMANTVFEFHGDYWHGNPKVFWPDDINPTVGLSYGELYARTMKKKAYIERMGYNYICMWENEWNRIRKATIKLQRHWRRRAARKMSE